MVNKIFFLKLILLRESNSVKGSQYRRHNVRHEGKVHFVYNKYKNKKMCYDCQGENSSQETK